MCLENFGIFFIMTIVPVALMGYYIYCRDEYKPEPWLALLLANIFGLICAAISIYVTSLWKFESFYQMDFSPLLEGHLSNEEIGEKILPLMKIILLNNGLTMGFLLVFLALNRFFDEQLDGIVYSSFIGLGFILLQNFIFLKHQESATVGTPTLRAFFLIPIFFFSSILMGYYASRLWFRRPRFNWRLAYDIVLFVAIPILSHLILIPLLLLAEIQIEPWLGVILSFLFSYFCFLFMSYAIQRIDSHLTRDVLEKRVTFPGNN